MDKIDFSIGCALQTVGRRAEWDTYFKHTLIGLQLVLVSNLWTVPFPKSERSRNFKKNKNFLIIRI